MHDNNNGDDGDDDDDDNAEKKLHTRDSERKRGRVSARNEEKSDFKVL